MMMLEGSPVFFLRDKDVRERRKEIVFKIGTRMKVFKDGRVWEYRKKEKKIEKEDSKPGSGSLFEAEEQVRARQNKLIGGKLATRPNKLINKSRWQKAGRGLFEVER